MGSSGALELALLAVVGQGAVARDARTDARTLVVHARLVLNAAGNVAPFAIRLQSNFLLMHF